MERCCHCGYFIHARNYEGLWTIKDINLIMNRRANIEHSWFILFRLFRFLPSPSKKTCKSLPGTTWRRVSGTGHVFDLRSFYNWKHVKFLLQRRHNFSFLMAFKPDREKPCETHLCKHSKNPPLWVIKSELLWIPSPNSSKPNHSKSAEISQLWSQFLVTTGMLSSCYLKHSSIYGSIFKTFSHQAW